jgi:hypothetical protein
MASFFLPTNRLSVNLGVAGWPPVLSQRLPQPTLSSRVPSRCGGAAILGGEKTSAIRTVAAAPWLHWSQCRAMNIMRRSDASDCLVKPYSGIPRGDFESFANFGTISATPSWLAECFYISRTELELRGLSLFR